MGGRAAEIIYIQKIVNKNENLNYDNFKLFNSVNDLEITSVPRFKTADNLARQYIQLFGIDSTNNIELPKTIQNPNSPYLTLSESTKTEIDESVSQLINYALKCAVNILESNLNNFNKLASDLIIKKTVDLKYLNGLNITYF